LADAHAWVGGHNEIYEKATAPLATPDYVNIPEEWRHE
jgi:hypothetical protein